MHESNHGKNISCDLCNGEQNLTPLVGIALKVSENLGGYIPDMYELQIFGMVRLGLSLDLVLSKETNTVYPHIVAAATILF